MKTKWLWAAGMATAAGLILLDALVLEHYLFKIKEYHIGVKDRNSRSLKILLLTDLHLKHKLSAKYKRLIDKIRTIAPDIILLAGDSLDENGKPEILDDFFRELPALTPKAAILGNHEYKNDASMRSIKDIFAQNKVDLLINKSKAYHFGEEKLMVTGLDDMVESDANFKKAVASVGHEKMHVGLIHTPLLQDKVEEQIPAINKKREKRDELNLSYLFAGHNHGGQVTAFGKPLILPDKAGHYVKGWYNDKKPYLYVSKGFGNSTLPVRFAARAEAILFHYHYT